MEEILASIRRIISDDVAADTAAATNAAKPAATSAEAPSVPVAPVAQPAAQPRAEAAPVRAAATSPEPRSFSRPLVSPAPRFSAGYSQAVARRPAVDPYVPRSYASAQPALADEPSVASQAVAAQPVVVDPVAAQPAEDVDLDAPFAAALMDLALVEQAVQAELANVTADIFSPASLEAEQAEEQASDEAAVETVAAADPVMPEAVPPVAATPAEPVLERAEIPPAAPEAVDMQVQAKPAPLSPRNIAAPASQPVVAAVEARPAQPVQAAAFPEAPRPERLVSTPTNTAVAASFGSLARTVASNSRSVEDVVTEAIRPMLKSWLDENLPALVERLVRAEIERVARQG